MTAPKPAAARPVNSHRVLVPVLATIGLICILLSTVSAWLRDSALDTGVWGDQSAQLLQKESVRNAVATYTVDQALTRTDARDAVANSLPPRLQPLAAPATAAIERLATEAVARALTLPRIQQLWVAANERTHRQLVDFLEGKTTRLQASNGDVQLQLGPIIANVAESVGGNAQAVSQAQSLPPIVVLRSDQLGAVQTMVSWIRVLSIWPLLIGVAMLGIAVRLSHGRRRQTVRGIAVGFVVMGVALLAARRIGGGVLVDSLTSSDLARPAAEDTWAIYTSLLAESAAAGIAIGLIGLIGTFLAGPSHIAWSLRHRAAPVVRDHPLAPHAVLAVVLLLALAVSPLGTPRRAIGVVLLAAIMFAGLEALRRQSVQELTAGGAGAVAPDVRLDRIERLAALHDQGVLSDDEFSAAAKSQTLRGRDAAPHT